MFASVLRMSRPNSDYVARQVIKAVITNDNDISAGGGYFADAPRAEGVVDEILLWKMEWLVWANSTD